MQIINDGHSYSVHSSKQEISPSPYKPKPYGQSPIVHGAAIKNGQKPVLAGVQSGNLTKTQSRILFANNQPSTMLPGGSAL